MGSLLRGAGPVLMMLAALLAPVAILATGAHGILTDEERFVESFAPLAADPEFQGHLVDRTVEELDIPALADRAAAELDSFGIAVPDGPVEIPSWLSGSAQVLEEWGVPSWITSPLQGGSASPTEIGVEIVSSGVEAALQSLVKTRGFHTAWRESLRGSHEQLLGQISAEAPPPTLTLDIGPIVAATREALIADGARFAQYIPEVDYEISLDVDMALLSRYGEPVLEYGSTGVWVPFALLVVGAAIARFRGAWLVVAGILTAGAAFLVRTLLLTGEVTTSTDPLTRSAVRALLDALTPVTAELLLKNIYAGGLAVLLGAAVMLLRPHRR